MKAKILTVCVGMLLLTTMVAVANTSEKPETNTLESSTQPLSFDEVDVPEWTTDNSWTYAIDNMEFVIDDENLTENLTIIINVQITDLVLEVLDVSGGEYHVGIPETVITGDYELETDLGEGLIRVTGELEDITLSGNLFFDQDTLGIIRFNGVIDGKLTVNIEEQPYFDRSVFPSIPIPATINVGLEMDTPFPVIEFPLNSTLDVWGIPALNVSLSGTIESLWLNIFNWINEKLRKWNLIGPISRLLGVDEVVMQNVSNIIDDILPVVDIEYVITEYLEADNILSIPEVPFMFFCNSTTEITVPAGTFDCYEIVIAGGLGTVYYAPDIGNIIKMEGNFADALPFLNGINAELTAYT